MQGHIIGRAYADLALEGACGKTQKPQLTAVWTKSYYRTSQ